ncbi:MAG: helix-turn-helix transcriptional regulator [Candidatus Baltobacteraceae bacterium]
MDLSLYSPGEIAQRVGRQAADLRLALGRRQADVATASGVSLQTLRRFEKGESVGFDAVVKIALALGAERDFASLFPARDVRTFDQILRESARGARRRKRAPRARR